MILILNDFEERAYIPVAINSYCTVSTNVEIKRIGRYFTAHYFLISVSILRQTVEEIDRKSTRLNSSHVRTSRMPSSA